MSGNYIRAWSDREGRVWLDTGHQNYQSGQPIIELINGEARGALDWVRGEFGPLQDLSVHTRAERRRAALERRSQTRAEEESA